MKSNVPSQPAENEDGWNASDYANSSAAQKSWASDLIEQLDLVGDEAILDVGCGDGKVTEMISKKVPYGSVLGIDRSQKMIDLACRQYQSTTLTFKQMDACSISLNKQFHLVFSNAALHWVKDHHAVLDGMHRHLLHGGKILLQMGGAGNAADMVSVVSNLITESPWSHYFKRFQFPYYFYTQEQYHQWVADAGFEIVDIRCFSLDMVHDNQAGLKAWLRTTWFPYTDCLPPHLQNEFLDQVVSRYLIDNPLCERGKTRVKMVRLQVEAVKP